MSERAPTVEAMDLLARLQSTTSSPEERELLAVARHALLFITSTGQRYAFTDFLQDLESNAPPTVVNAFDTREEAMNWLRQHPAPPDSALVLVAGRYHVVLYSRENNHRHLTPLPVIEYHLGRLRRAGLSPAVATFQTREEADAWLGRQSAPPRQAIITIADEPFLAVFHPNVAHRALHPFALARDEEEPDESEPSPP